MNPESTARAPEVIRLNDSIHQLYRPAGSRRMKVVFFHGFQLEDYESAHTKTWTSGDGSVWPQTWLVEKFPEAHVLSVSYNRWVTNDRDGGTMDLFNICENLRSDLSSADRNEPRCPIILVGHSFGGLVIKELCVHVSNRMGYERDSTTKASLEYFLNDVTGIFFYATPHRGMRKEALAVFAAENRSLAEYVKTLSTHAARTDSNFSPLSEVYKWQIVGLGESQPLKRSGFLDLEVTAEASSRYGWRFNIAENTNHITITRPTAKNQRNFTALVTLLNEIKPKGVEVERPVHQPAPKRSCIVATVNDIDGLYVPIDKPHSAVIKAIEDLHGPSMILLHGGVGKGKSTLARSMIHHYGIEEDTNDGKKFDNVIWISCGNCSTDEISTKQLEILQDHSPNSLGDSPPEEKTNLRHRIAKALLEFFGDKKILMILDDVSDEWFLYAMWEAATGGKASAGGKGVKILVTSQWGNICAKAGLSNDSCRIFMEDPTEGEAMKILASLVGLEGGCIPHHLQPTAKEMIKVTERNPLALACLASNFVYSEDTKDQEAWQDALKGLRRLLDSPEERLVLPVTVPGKPDPRSLCGAMKICIDSLKTKDAKKILFFMYAFKEESAPELVLRILHGSLKRSNCTFSKSRDELGMRELLKIHRGPQQPTSLSLRSLVKLYMEHTNMVGENEIKSLIDELLHDKEQAPQSSSAEIKQGDEIDRVEWEKARVAVTLSALYFNRHDARINKILTEAMTRANVTYCNDGINNLRREAVYPILSLMDEPEDEHWKESDASSARQVFLTYICKHELDHENISHLLELAACTTAQFATLKAIRQIFTIEKGPQLRSFGNHEGTLRSLVKLISLHETPANVQVEATRALQNLAAVEDAVLKLRIVDEEGTLEGLVKLLSMHGKPKTQEYAAAALGNLAWMADSSLQLRIANHEGTLRSLVELMSSHETPANVQAQATRALQNLAAGEDAVLKLRIVDEEGALEGLVKLLSMQNKPKTQESAAAALGNLAWMADSSLQLRIANHEGTLRSLVKLMSSHETPANVQAGATRALGNLANTKDDILKLRIVDEEGALEGLVKLLFMHDKPITQEYATATLGNLIDTEDDILMLRIVDEEGALEGLVKLLSMHDNPKTQEYAAPTLGNLASMADSSLKLRIANHEGTLRSLVELMSSHETPANVQAQATRSLQNLAAGEDVVLKLRIVDEEGALEGLVKLLSMHNKPKTQESAAAALGNLAWMVDSSLQLRIANHEGTLRSLVELMSSHETPANVQAQATRALQNLAAGEDAVLKLRIVDEEGALEGLVKLLSMHNKPKTQESAAAALGNLAWMADSSLQLRIANHEGTLRSLVKLMSSHETPANVQAGATRALGNLANTEDDILMLRIVDEEGALEGLVKLLSMHDKPKTQEYAAATLGNLASMADSSLKLRIANHEGTLRSLVELMSSHETPANVQAQATRSLQNLAAGEDAVLKLRIVDEEGALEGLVKLLSMHNKPKTQESAAAALGNLAWMVDSSLQLRIANHEGTLRSLVELMSSHETPANVQAQATRALQNLAAGEDAVLKLRIVDEEGALEGLVKLLSMHNKPKTQESAAAALGNLAWMADSSLQLRIANHEGTLRSLVKLMSSHETPANVQAGATRALGNLANTKDDILMLRIVDEEGALEGLVKLLSMHDKPKTQEYAPPTLGNLACVADSSLKLRIANHERVLDTLGKLKSSRETAANVQAQATRALRNLA